MNTETPQKNFYAVITSEVLFNKSLSPRQKILIAMISNMSNEKGYCWSSNEYFAGCLDTSERTIRYDLEDLEEKKSIGRILRKNSQGVVIERKLTVIGYNPAASQIESPTKPKKRTKKEDGDPTFTNSKTQAIQQSTEIDLFWLELKSLYKAENDKAIANARTITKSKSVLSNFTKEEREKILKLFKGYNTQLKCDNPWLSSFFHHRDTLEKVEDYFRTIKSKVPKAPKAPNDPNKWIGDFSNIEMSQEQIERLEKARQAIKK